MKRARNADPNERVNMTRAQGLVVGLALLLVVGAPSLAADFRIYRANDKLQLDRVPTMNEDQPGCHNLLLSLTIYRVAQIGFQHCSVYAEKDCQAGSEVPVSWKQEQAPVTRFTQGDRWFLVSDDPRGHKIGSWSCSARE